MVETTTGIGAETGADNAKNHFDKAVEEAKAGAQALAGECRDKIHQAKSDFADSAKCHSDEAKEKAEAFAADAKGKASDLAIEGKAKASQAISSLSRLIDENANLIDDKVGYRYGDYARSASQSLQSAATRLNEKSFEELTEDTREFVRTRPGTAVGIAVAAGFVLARLFKGK